MAVKRQHYIFRKYLEPWCENNQIYCRNNSNIIHTNVMNIGQQKYNYRLQEMSIKDILLLKQFFAYKAPGFFQSLDNEWIETFTFLFEIKSFKEQSGVISQEIENMLQDKINTLGEDIHTHIEHIGIPFLEKLYNKDTSFFYQDKENAKFSYFLATQYFRTKKMQKNVINQDFSSDFIDFEACWNLCSHVFATRVGFGLYSERARFKCILLVNNSNTSFITGDQPVININADYKITQILKDNEFELYYPLRPDLALLITQNKENIQNNTKLLDEEEVKYYNKKIFEASDSQIYANNQHIFIEFEEN